MKKIFVICAVALVVASCANDKKTDEVKKTDTTTECVAPVEGKLPIAIVNTDTLLNNYFMAIEANETLMTKQEDASLELNQRASGLEKEMIDFQRKVENNAFLSRERAEAEQRRLLNKQQELQNLEQQKTQELMLEQQTVSLQLRDSINAAIKVINADGKYHLIITNSMLNDNILFAAPEYDITMEVLELLNSRYESIEKKK